MDLQNEYGEIALIIACQCSKLLIKSDPTLQTSYGDTILSLSLLTRPEHESIQMIKYVLNL